MTGNAARSAMTEPATLVVGASRGLGRGIALAFAQAGASVVAIARASADLEELAGVSGNIRIEVADAADAGAAASLLDQHRPEVLVLVAGATPLMRPLQEQTWDTFSVNWNTDVRIAFHWLQQALRRPLPPGGRVIVISSGAALAGSPLSGGYAGAKATQRFMTGYAQDEAQRAGLDLTFTTVLPRLTPLTDLGRPAVQAYAARAGQSEQEYLAQMGPPLTPEIAGRAVVSLAQSDTATLAPAYLLTGSGIQPLA